MWTETDSGNGSSLNTSLHAIMTSQSHVTYPPALNLSDSFNSFNHSLKRPRSILDSQSHRVIEKRRRDRMNNCLADLGQLVADASDAHGIKHSGQGRIKKTEIIEMAIDRIRALQAQIIETQVRNDDRLLQGFKECRDVAVRYLVDQHGQDAVGPLCSGLLVHLHDHLHSICRVGSTFAPSQGKRSNDRNSAISAISASVATKAAALVYGMSGIVSDDVVWKQTDQIYVKPEAVTPDTAAFVDDELVSVVNDLASNSTVQRTSRGSLVAGPRRVSEANHGAVEKAEPTNINVATSDDGGDEICWNGTASNDEEEEEDAGSLSRRHLYESNKRQRQLQQQRNGGYKYKDSIKRRFCSESDARSWNESASDCSSTVGGGSRLSAVEMSGREAEGGGGEGSSGTGTLAVASPPTSPEDHINLEPSTAVEQPQTVQPSASVLSSKFAIRSGHCCSSNTTPTAITKRSPGFILHPSGGYYLPVFVTGPCRRRAVTERADSNASGIVDSDDGCCDDEEDEEEDEMSTLSQSSSEALCHPVSIPVNLSGGLVPVICGCSVGPRRGCVDSSGRRRVVSEPPAGPAPSSLPGRHIPIGNGRRFPSAPVLLNRL